MTDKPRLIEYAFPLKQASLDSVHEKNVRHGHISTLHIWPARRPLAACRAALIATLLPDPGTPEGRQELCEKIGGKVVKKIERKKMPGGRVVEREKEETGGGILHWKRETENAEDLEWFRQEIRKAYGGRAPKVLDPFAGGGAIPLEAMRLGCEATAIDINPVAWFILKCTLEYPQKLTGQKHPLPDFILKDRAFMGEFFKKAQGMGKAEIRSQLKKLGVAANEDQQSFDFDKAKDVNIEADLAWHVRAWGQWVLDHARRDLAQFYPTYADFEPLKKDVKSYEKQPLRLVPLKEDGTPDIDALNGEFSEDYLEGKSNPRWVAKPTVAYLWARTVTCKNCRATLPLLKTRWLCKKDRKRVLLRMEPNEGKTGVIFGIEKDVPIKGGNAAQRREHDRRLGAGTMTRAGATCPCCGLPSMTMEDIQVEAKASRWSDVHFCTVVDGMAGKEYRAPTNDEGEAFKLGAEALSKQRIPGGPLVEPIDSARPSPNARGLSGLTRYGLDSFGKVFNTRQTLALSTLARCTAASDSSLSAAYATEWVNAIIAELALAVDRVADRNSGLCHWDMGYQKIAGTFQRYALRVNWDYCEVNPFATTTGNYLSAVEWIARVLDHTLACLSTSPTPNVVRASAERLADELPQHDLILTDPPYYDAIPYSDLSDFFYVWLRRTIGNSYPDEFAAELTPKDAELIQHSGRTQGDHVKAREFYERGMAVAFASAREKLTDNGRMVVVFANKQPEAWETLASSIIRGGFTVDASWPIETEMPNKAAGGARLSSSIWLVCRKRPATARPGWDNAVLDEMRGNIKTKLREFWDSGIRGPDFVWAATGPALEAYSKHPVVKKANDPGPMTVSEFLTHVRRMVVDFVVGRVLAGDGDEGGDASADRLDDPTSYYLLHRHDFGFEEAPAGTCILYAVSCGLSDRELVDNWNLLSKGGGSTTTANGNDVDPDAEAEAEEGSGSKLKLKTWAQRKNRTMGYEAPGGRPVPLIDQVHRLLHLWRGGDVHKVDEYLDDYGLRRQELFGRLLQSLIELSEPGSDERSILESLSNHIGAKGAKKADPQKALTFGDDE